MGHPKKVVRSRILYFPRLARQREPKLTSQVARTRLVFQRTYRAQPVTHNDAGIGSLWLHNWQMKLGLANAGSSTPQVFAYRADGNRVTFNKTSGTWRTAGFTGLALIQDGKSWTLTDLATETTESYSSEGVLLSEKTHNGHTFTLTYSDTSTPSNIAPARRVAGFGFGFGFGFGACNRI